MNQKVYTTYMMHQNLLNYILIELIERTMKIIFRKIQASLHYCTLKICAMYIAVHNGIKILNNINKIKSIVSL